MFSGWVDDSVFMQCPPNESLWINNYSKHAFTTGRHHMSKSRFKNSNHTMKVKENFSICMYYFKTVEILWDMKLKLTMIL